MRTSRGGRVLATGNPGLNLRVGRLPLFMVLPLALATILSACAGSSSSGPGLGARSSDRYDSKWGVSSSRRVIVNGPIPKGGGHRKLGKPYQVAGRWYVPQHDPRYDRVGVGSWYGDDFHGRKTANGEIFDMNALTAAHPTLPIPSYAYVTNLKNGRTLLVRINDRGPYVANRIIDLSRASAKALGYFNGGLSRVRVRYAGPAPLNGDDRREVAFLRNQPWYYGGGYGNRMALGADNRARQQHAGYPNDRYSQQQRRQDEFFAGRRPYPAPRNNRGPISTGELAPMDGFDRPAPRHETRRPVEMAGRQQQRWSPFAHRQAVRGR